VDLVCPACTSVSTVPDDRLPPEGARARCGSCGGFSVYLRGGLVDDAPTPPQTLPAVALPGMPSAVRPSATPPLDVVTGTTRAAAAQAGHELWTLRALAGDEGPLDLAVLKTRIRTGALSEHSMLAVHGATEWKRAAEWPELARYFNLKRKTAVAAAAAPVAAPAEPERVACWKHPEAHGRWLCTSCGATSCDSCVVTTQILRTTVRACPKCEKVVQEIVPTKVIVPFWKQLPQVMGFPVRDGAWVGLLICAVVGVMIGMASAAPGILGLAAASFPTLCIYAYHLFIIRETAKGKRTLPNFGKVEDYRTDMVYPGFKAFFVSLIIMIPLAFWSGSRVVPAQKDVMVAEANLTSEKQAAARRAAGTEAPVDENQQALAEALVAVGGGGAGFPSGSSSADDEDDSAPAWQKVWDEEGKADPRAGVVAAEKRLAEARSSLFTARMIQIALFGWALVLWPALLIIVALFNTIAPAFHPGVVLRLIREIPTEYAWCVVFTGVLMGLGLTLAAFLGVIPIAGIVLGNVVLAYCSFATAHVMGRTAEMADQKLDWS
jgi:predicted Zn finger-like uncharacterized protein